MAKLRKANQNKKRPIPITNGGTDHTQKLAFLDDGAGLGVAVEQKCQKVKSHATRDERQQYEQMG